MATMPVRTEERSGQAVSTRTPKKRKRKESRLSRMHKPPAMPLETWQRELRHQFGREQEFRSKNIGEHPVFSEFEVTNPQSGNTYRVAIRGTQPGDNFCSCPDFATNLLGTCKHIEFILFSLERKRGGKSALRAGFQPPYSEVYLHYGLTREVRFRPGAECPVQLARTAAEYFGPDGALLPAALSKFERFLADAARIEHDLRCYEDTLLFVAELRDAERRRARLAEAFARGIRSPAFKNLLKAPLYDYQREGALFAAGAGRCLLGDEMGLGKTVQAIAAAEIMAKLFGLERVLVICPTSLKHQWEREIGRFVDRTVTVVGGMRPRREQDFAGPSFYKITNYDTVHRDLDLIRGWGPELVILDEAQRIKNWSTRVARHVKRIASPYALVLTGTPLENRLEELISIVQFVDQYRLGPTYRLLHDHQVRDEVGRVVGYRNLDQIGKTLEPILLRRHKDQVLDQLPERLDKHFFVAMTPEQMGHHEENKEIVARIVQKWQRYRFLSEADQRRLMIALQNMRMSCDSTYLLDHQTDFGVKADELATLLEEIYEDSDSKVVIFSQWLRMHELLLRRFNHRKWKYVLFHGGVPGPRRKDLVDQFREDAGCRAFLATDAGGVGLNLQHASVVVNVDLPWNPAVLEQRIGRVHRLGQRRPVRVVNFVSRGTIEEGMLSVLKFKKGLFTGVLDGGEKEVFLGGSRLQRFMQTVERAGAAIPAAIPEEGEEPPERPSASRETLLPAKVGPAAPPWQGLLQTGIAFLQELTRTALPASGERKSSKTKGDMASLVTQDARTGEPYLRLPLPAPAVIDQALRALRMLLEGREG